MEKEISITQFIQAIKRLPEDEPREYPHKWYRTQKQHWLGWLEEYDGSGAYGRKTSLKRDAKYAYNHVVCPEILMYLFRVIPLQPELVKAAESAYQEGSTMMENSGAFRKVVPWAEIYLALWGNEKWSILDLFRSASNK